MKIIINEYFGVCVSNLDSGQGDNNKSISNRSADLAIKIINGDTIAKNQFVEINYKWLLFIVRRKFMRSNNHEDIVQDAFILVLNNLQQGKVNQPKTIVSYLRTSAINIGYQYLRQDKKFKSSIDHDLLEEIESAKEDVLATIIWNDRTKYVKQVITELKIKRDQEILYGFYFQDQSKASICQRLTLSSEHFDRVLYRAKQRLKQLIIDKDNNKPHNDTQSSSKKETVTNKYNMMLKTIQKMIQPLFQKLYRLVKNQQLQNLEYKHD